jgi:general secretion pathway protein F
MPVYQYVGVNSQGKKTRGTFDADNPRTLRDQLKGQGIFLTEFFEGKAGAEKRAGEVQIKSPWKDRISLMDISILTRQLATLQKAGIPLVESLSALIEQSEKESLKGVISTVRQKVNEGSALASAMGEHPQVFSDLYVHMIRAGETSGNLDVVLLRLTEFLDDQVELQQKLISAAVYPLLMIVLGGFIVAYLMASVVPKVTQIFEDQDAALPLITQILILISNLIAGWWWLMIAMAAGGFYFFNRWKNTPEGRRKWDQFVLRLPIFGSLTRMIAVSRFSKTMATLLGSGVALLGAMDIVKNILGNTVLIEVVEKARLNIREGESIAGPLKRSGEFPPMVTHMIAVGERTGELEAMLENVADAYDQQVSARISALTSLLEPLMIVVMGGAVGFIVFAILLPILRMNEAFTQ